ncbi:hypothetical protein HAX54_034924 [Datura stramonium]|uniref:Uncharacterized protein n=1 Tax=Datura stramonium TaxID=4076 RepID=A0ABS8SFM8_DATST|nr:hypothetical protein [Datura stramonium]
MEDLDVRMDLTDDLLHMCSLFGPWIFVKLQVFVGSGEQLALMKIFGGIASSFYPDVHSLKALSLKRSSMPHALKHVEILSFLDASYCKHFSRVCEAGYADCSQAS